MINCRPTALLFLLVFWGFADAAFAQQELELVPEKRIALVIANSAYEESVGRLNNTNDAKLIASALGRVGFDVIVQNDLKLVPLRRTAADYAKRLREAGSRTVGFFFYSGHGPPNLSSALII